MSQPLYILSAAYQELLDLADSADPADQQAFSDTIEGLEGEIREKIANCAAVIRSLESQADAVEAEEKRLAARRKAMLASRDRLKAYVLKAMQDTGIERTKSPLFTIWLQDSPPSCVLDESVDVATLPERYRRVKYEPNKTAIADDLKAGVKLPFARLAVNKGLRIR